MRAPTPAAIAPSWRTPPRVIASHQPLCFIVFSMTSLAIILSQSQHAASTGIFLFDGTETRYSRIQNNRPQRQSHRADGLPDSIVKQPAAVLPSRGASQIVGRDGPCASANSAAASAAGALSGRFFS